MVATTRRSPEPPGPALRRFDRAERAVHWSVAGLVAVLVVSGAALYLPEVMALVGRRRLVEDVHLAAGLALPIPVLAGLASRSYRADLRRFNRWSVNDRAWLRAALGPGAASRRRGLVVAKFNAGQKLNAAFVAGALAVMLATGVVMYWYHPWPLSWREGATYTHDWVAAAVVVVVLGHVRMALRHPDSLRSMLRGTIPRAWAEREAPGWLVEEEAPGPPRRG